MSNGIVAKRYAVALFKIAKEKHVLEMFEEELRLVQNVYEKNGELHSFLTQPNISKSEEDVSCKRIPDAFLNLF